MDKPPVHSPWGEPDYTREQAPGIWWVETPSHGGILLSPERQAEVEAKAPDFKPFAGRGAYEEDCDWIVVALVFAAAFSDADLWAARDAALWHKQAKALTHLLPANKTGIPARY